MGFRGFSSLNGLQTYVRIARNDAYQASKITTSSEARDAMDIVREHAQRLFDHLQQEPGFHDEGYAPGVRSAASNVLVTFSALGTDEIYNGQLMQLRQAMTSFYQAIDALGILPKE